MTHPSSLRSQVKLIVALSPGIHLRKLQKLLRASFTTTRYHVDNLERAGELIRTKDGRYDRLYPVGTPERMRPVYAVLQSKTARRILSAMTEPGEDEPTGTGLSARLGISRGSLSEYLGMLTETGLLRRSWGPDGKMTYLVKDRVEVKLLLSSFDRNLLSMATDGFIDLWDL